jgi:hypothetical protein
MFITQKDYESNVFLILTYGFDFLEGLDFFR